MAKDMCTVWIGNEEKVYEKGTTYEQIAKEYQKEYSDDIVLVFADEKLQELPKKIKPGCRIEFVTTALAVGIATYRRSMCLLLVKAIYDVAGRENVQKVRIQFSVSKGYYCTAKGEFQITAEFLAKVREKMHQMVSERIPIKKRSVHVDDAIALFRKYGMYDKERLFRYRRVSAVNLYSINGFEDYYYGYMLYSTGYLKYFKLYKYDEGFVIQMPDRSAPETVPPFEPQNKLFQVLKESTKWGDMQGIETVGALNDKITKGDMMETVLVQEALQELSLIHI